MCNCVYALVVLVLTGARLECERDYEMISNPPLIRFEDHWQDGGMFRHDLEDHSSLESKEPKPVVIRLKGRPASGLFFLDSQRRMGVLSDKIEVGHFVILPNFNFAADGDPRKVLVVKVHT